MATTDLNFNGSVSGGELTHRPQIVTGLVMTAVPANN